MSLIAFDLTRLFLGPLSASPRGIDRVDYLLARHFFPDGASAHLGVLATPWGVRAFPAARVMRGLDHLARLWGEREDAHDHDRLNWLAQRLSGKGVDPFRRIAGRLGRRDKIARMLRHLRATGIAGGHSVVHALPRGAMYLNTGQISLAVPGFFRWLDHRPDVTAAFMLHDTIPLDMPEKVSPSSVAHHARMIRTTARHAHALITTTRHANRQVMRALAREGRERLPILVRGLPLSESFSYGGRAPEWLARHSYFVVCSTIEPRKNHALLFEVWRQLVERDAKAAPHLVVVGGRGWKSDEILRRVDTPRLHARIHHVSGLSTPALGRLMQGAQALLSPSLAEGFGLPVLEAGMLGVPVFASDIPSHREIVRPGMQLLPPHDAQAWLDAIVRHRRPENRLPEAMVPPADRDEKAYARDIQAFLQHCASERLAGRLSPSLH